MTVEAWKNPLVSRISRSLYLCLHSCLVCFLLVSFMSDLDVQVSRAVGLSAPLTGGKGSLTQWVHCEFVVSFEAIRPVITQRVCGEFF